jgi:hypothetical protein
VAVSDIDGHRALRLVLAVLLASLLLVAAVAAITYDPPDLGPVDVDDPANGSTIVSVQGYNIGGETRESKPARLVSAGPNGHVEWNHSAARFNVSWFYDVDPLADGDLLVVGTVDGDTRVSRYDPDADTIVWQEHLDLWDTHDITLTERGNLLIANMRNTNNGTSDDRVYVYNRTTDTVEWEWLFRNHYPNSTDNGVGSGDWTHVNDVDVVAPGLYALSPRNFDQVIVVNRSTGDIVMRLGRDGNLSVLDEQHNPSYLETDDGRPAFLVADSENDRVVEYTCDRGDPDHPLDGDMEPNCDWTRTWTVGVDQLGWPRDADRLPNGNTLVTDTLNHRVLEVTPRGEVVWEFAAPWLPFDAERPQYGHEPAGPTMADLNVSGSYVLDRSESTETVHAGTVPTRIREAAAAIPGGGVVTAVIETYQGAVPWVRPVWMSPSTLFLLVVGLLVGLVWALVEGYAHRERLRNGVRALRGRI